MIRKNKNSILLVFTIFLVTIFLMFILSIRESDNINKQDIPKLGNMQETNLLLENASNIDGKTIMDIINRQEDIVVKSDYTSNGFDASGIGIYSNYDDPNLPSLLEGNFIPKNYMDVKNIIVIGKDLVNYCNIINNKKYYEVKEKNYEVIGVMGYQNRTSVFDKTYFTNYDFNTNDLNSDRLYLSIYSNYNKEYKVKQIMQEINSLGDFNCKISDNIDNQEVINDRVSSTEELLMLIIFIITILMISNFWITKKSKEISISKMYGATEKNITFSNSIEYICCIIIGMILGLVIYYIMSELPFLYQKMNLSIVFYKTNVYKTLIIELLISIVLVILVISKKTIGIEPIDMLNNQNSVVNKNKGFILLIFLVIFQVTLLLYYFSNTFYNYLELQTQLSENRDILPYDNLYKIEINDINNSFESISGEKKLKFLEELKNAKSFTLVSADDAGVYIDKIIDDPTLYQRNGSNFYDKTDYLGKSISPFNCLFVNKAFIENSNIKIVNGKNLKKEDFNSNIYSNEISIIVGNNFSKYLKLNDTVNMLEPAGLKYIKLRIVGIIQKDMLFSNLGTITGKESLDNFIILPYIYDNIEYASSIGNIKKAIECNLVERQIKDTTSIKLRDNYTYNQAIEELRFICNNNDMPHYNIREVQLLMDWRNSIIRDTTNLFLYRTILVCIFALITIMISFKILIERNTNKYSIQILCGASVRKILIKIISYAIIILLVCSGLAILLNYQQNEIYGYPNQISDIVKFLLFNLITSFILIVFIYIYLKNKININSILELTKRRD